MWTELRSQLLFSQYNNLISRFSELSSYWTRKNRIVWPIHIINAEIYCLNASRYERAYMVLGNEKHILYYNKLYAWCRWKSNGTKRTFRDVRPSRWICYFSLRTGYTMMYAWRHHDVMMWSQNVSFSLWHITHTLYLYNTVLYVDGLPEDEKITSGARLRIVTRDDFIWFIRVIQTEVWDFESIDEMCLRPRFEYLNAVLSDINNYCP